MSLILRLYLGMAALIVLIAVVGGIGAYKTNELADVFSSFQQAANTAVLTSEVMEDVMEAQFAAVEFQETLAPEYWDEIVDNVADIQQDHKVLLSIFSGSPEEEVIARIADDMMIYQTLLASYRSHQEGIDRTAADLIRVRERAKLQLRELTESLTRDVNNVAARRTNAALLKVMEGMSQLDQFLVVGNQALNTAAAARLREARADVAAVREGLMQIRQIELADAIDNGLDQISVSILALADAIRARKMQVESLTEIGAGVIRRIDIAGDATTRQKDRLAVAASDATRETLGWLTGIVIIGALGGAVIAFLFGRVLSRGISDMTDIMTQVAAGNLAVEVHPSDRTDELAKMNNAMVVFIESTRRARELTAQMADAKELEKERAEAERIREAHRESEAKAAAERAQAAKLESNRLSAVEAFQKDMRHVIATAAAGDFSNRMDADDTDENLLALATSVNQLLDAIQNNIAKVLAGTSALAAGQLDIRISGDQSGAFLQLKQDFNAAVETLSQSMARITQTGLGVSASSAELDEAARGMASRAENGAVSIEQTSAAVEELTASVKQMVGNTRVVDQATSRVRETALETREISSETEDAIGALSEASAQINTVVQVIEDIAFQINLLALNAGVEAARAGEAGRGFSVVASEVRALALRSQGAVREINDVILKNNKVVEESVEKVGRTRSSVDTIVTEVDRAATQISEIALAVEQQALGLEEINSAVQTIDSNAQANAAAIQDMTAASASLSQEADTLAETLRTFKGIEHHEDRPPQGLLVAVPAANLPAPAA